MININIANCELEAIRFPGAVQSHGVLLAMQAPSGIIEAASETCETLLGIRASDVLGQSVVNILGFKPEPEPGGAADNEHPAFVHFCLNGAELCAHPHNNSTGQVLIDIEAAKTDSVLVHTLVHSWHRQFTYLRNLDNMALLQKSVELIRAMTGFDRVMIYRFDPGWAGEVIAESCAENTTAYLGHHFPAGDIPEQARELFQLEKVRQIPDVHYSPSVLVASGDKHAIDLGHSSLRSVSPMHIEYLKNMQVRATLTGALVVNGRLWGLVAGHHTRQPKLLSPDERKTFGWICEDIAVLVEAALARKSLERSTQLAAYRRSLVDMLRTSDIREFMRGARGPMLLEALSADGFALIVNNHIQSIGNTPEPNRVLEMHRRRLDIARGAQLFSSHALNQDLGLPENSDGVAGAIFVSVTKRPHIALAWFRNERSSSVRWAGDPGHAHSVGKDGGISPRKSFATFLQYIRGQSRVWEPEELDTAQELRELIELQMLSEAETLLTKSRAQLTTFVENAPICMAMLDQNLNYLATSSRWHLDYGRGHENLAGLNHCQILADLPGEWKDIYRRVMSGHMHFKNEDIWLHADGNKDYLRWSATPWQNEKGETGGILISIENTTDQHLAHQSVLETQERLAAIINASMDAILSIDEDERILTFNTAAEKLFLVSADAVIGQQLDRFIPARYRADHHGYIRKVANSCGLAQQMTRNCKGRALRADGTEFPFEAAIATIPERGKRIFTVTMRDVAAIQQAEAARRSLETQLRESQKMEAMGTMAGGIAHDFNNIVAVVLGYSKLATEELAGQSQEALGYIGEIRKAAVRARELVKQILAFSRKQQTTRTITGLEPIVEESARLLRFLMPARISLNVQCEPDVPSVLADVNQIQQVLINLATNAMQAMNGKSGCIDIHLGAGVPDSACLNAHPTLHSLCKGGSVRTVILTIRDNGGGIEAAALGKIFDPFFTTKPVGEGTGLGLAVVQGIVQGHEGEIVVDSTPGQGTTFRIYLPVADPRQAQPEQQPMRPVAAARTGNNRHVLYIDDEESQVVLSKLQLQRRGYRVSAYWDALEALAVLREAPMLVDVVVTDYNMPGISGIDVAREVRALRPDLPVVMTSGYVDEALKKSAAAAGVRQVVFKGADEEGLCEVLSSLFQTEAAEKVS